jgi:hypothetical protein
MVHDRAELALSNGQVLAEGDRVLLPRDSEASIVLSTGTHLHLEGGADLTLVEARSTQRLHLAAGSMHLDVAKLRAGERFLVRTGDAEIEVRGTSFQVVAAASIDPSCEDRTTTRVTVREGIVSVRAGASEARVGAGEAWPRGCGAAPALPAATETSSPPPVQQAPSATIPAPRAPRSTGSAVHNGAASATSATSASDLAAQNDALAAAVAAKRSGDTETALAGFDRFLSTYPRSPLTETVVVERMKLLATTHPARGLQAARDYLARYPHGFARADAETILEGGL